MIENNSMQMNKNKRVPKPFPSKTILPTFNSLAYFVVSPGESFHSVQEVFCDRPRLTIQGMSSKSAYKCVILKSND